MDAATKATLYKMLNKKGQWYYDALFAKIVRENAILDALIDGFYVS